MRKNLVIIDDHPALREGLKLFVESQKDFKVCGEADNTSNAIKIINNQKPEIVIVDLSLGGKLSGFELIKAINKRFPTIRVLVLSMYEEKLYAERCLKAGAMGYIMKTEGLDNIVYAIRTVLDGNIYLSKKISNNLLSKLIKGNKYSQLDSVDLLSNKEFEVFQFIGKGLSSREIAIKMNLSKNTIDSHKRHIKEKLNLKSSAELILYSAQWSVWSK